MSQAQKEATDASNADLERRASRLSRRLQEQKDLLAKEISLREHAMLDLKTKARAQSSPGL